MTADVQVIRNDDKQRYEIVLDGTVAGYTTFRPDEQGRLVFPHTIIDPAFAGQGLGSKLVSAAMADVAARSEAVVPVCPFVVKYLGSHDVPGLQVDWPTIADEAGSDAIDNPEQ